MPQTVKGTIKLASTPSLTKAKENASLPIWGSVAYFDEYAPPIHDFVGGEVAIILAIISLEPLGSGMVSPDLPLTAMLPVVLLTLLGLGA